MNQRVFESATVVLGMHRSGTSALAGVLRHCGLIAPRTLVPNAEGNKKGLWESEPIKELNDVALEMLGLSWHNLGQIASNSFAGDRFNGLRDEAAKSLKAEFPANSNILLKEPRLCRTLPFWQPILAECAGEAVYIFIVRNPLESAGSLARRNNLALDHGLMLWVRYMLDAEFYTRGKRRTFVSLTRLIEDWRGTVARLTAELNLPIDNDRIAADSIDEYMAPELIHHREDDACALENRLGPVAGAYRIFLGWTNGSASDRSEFEELDAIRGDIDRIAAPVSAIVEESRLDRKRLSNARLQLEKTAGDLATAQKAVQQLGELSGALAEQSRTIASLNSEAREFRAEQKISLEALEKAMMERRALEQAIAGLSSQLEDAVRRHADERATLVANHQDEVTKAAEKYAELLSNHEQSLQQASEQLAQALQKADQADAALREVRTERDSLDQELGRVKHKYRAAQYDVERERKAHAGTRSQLANAKVALARYENSAAWRAYLALVRCWKRLAAFASRLSGASRARRREQLLTIAQSSLFDADWYLKEYPDVAAARVDPLIHFFDTGWREGRDPGPSFVTSAYLKANADVARSGVNPVVHYLEFGRSEGREVRAHLPSGGTAPIAVHDFPEAAAVFRGEAQSTPPLRWSRSHRFSGDDPRAYLADGLVVGMVEQPDRRPAVESAFARLSRLSGLASGKPHEREGSAEYASAKLIDAWYFNSIGLRSRWRDGSWPFVVRAYQHEPSTGALRNVGEGLLASELDFLDVNLTDPYFPVLFVFSEPEGAIRGAHLLAFPSLCRGGLHYPELLALSPQDPDPLEAGLGHAARIEDARLNPARLLRAIGVKLEGADGTTPIFDRAFRNWLEKVARISVAADGPAGPAAELLESRSLKLGGGAGILHLAADTVPSLSILGQVEGKHEASESPLFLSMVVAGPEASQPATLLTIPAAAPRAVGESASGYASPWPYLVPQRPLRLPEISKPAAIRIGAHRSIADSELLVPAMGAALAIPGESDDTLTWLIFPQEWDSQQLLQTIRALSAQSGAGRHRIAFVGEVGNEAFDLANRQFEDRVGIFEDRAAAITQLETALAGYVGPGVILHDRRSVSYLAHLLRDPAVASAACALLTAERRGKGWHVSVADVGTLPGTVEQNAAFQSRLPQLLWRTSFPVSKPPKDLWIARRSLVKKWIGSRPPQRLRSGAHVCTTLISASYLKTRSDTSPEIRVPSAADNFALSTRVLFG